MVRRCLGRRPGILDGTMLESQPVLLGDTDHADDGTASGDKWLLSSSLVVVMTSCGRVRSELPSLARSSWVFGGSLLVFQNALENGFIHVGVSALDCEVGDAAFSSLFLLDFPNAISLRGPLILGDGELRGSELSGTWSSMDSHDLPKARFRVSRGCGGAAMSTASFCGGTRLIWI